MNTPEFIFNHLKNYLNTIIEIFLTIFLYMNDSLSKILGDNTCVYVSGYSIASNKQILTKHNITHIINCTKEIPNYFPTEFKYLKLDMLDTNDDLSQHFPSVLDFINECINNHG